MERIVGPYPPPPPRAPSPAPAGDDAFEALLARPPVVTRYATSRRRSPGRARLSAPRAWAATSALLAAAGVAAVVLVPQDTSRAARLDAPVAVLAAPADPTSSTGTTPGRVPATDEPRQLPDGDPVRVQIPALGVTSEIMELGLERDGAMEVPPGAYPVGWYHGSSTPGQPGPAVLAGHVDWHGEPGAFYGLRELLPGDAVVIDRADGSTVTFRVDRVETHPKAEFPTDEVYGEIDSAGLRLITCGGAFDDDTGNYQANVVVFASLTTTGPESTTRS